MKEKIPMHLRIKKVIIIIIAIFAIGFIFQRVYNFVGNENIKYKINYTRIDSKRIDYKTNGSGDYTVIFDGPIGTNLNVWDSVIENLNKLNVKTFVYNRPGYGLSEANNGYKTPESQAELLNKLLKKAAVTGNYILVGEGYGSIIMTNFAKLYPDKVKGMVLINPVNEDNTKYHTIKYGAELFWKNVQNFGSDFFITYILDKIGLTTNYTQFKDSIKNEYALKAYEWKENTKPYREAIFNETSNIYNKEGNIQTDGIFGKIPLYILSNEKNNPLKKLGSSEITKEYYVKDSNTMLSLTNPKDIVNGITEVYDEANRIIARNGN